MSERHAVIEYLHRLRCWWFPDWQSAVWLVFALLPIYFLQTFIHEFSHAVTTAAAGEAFPKFAPFPHENPSLGFVNGVTFSTAGFPATPQFVAFVMILALSLVGWLAPIRNRVAQLVIRVLFLAACVDLMYNTAAGLVGGSDSLSDWNKFSREASIEGGILALISWILWLIALSHFLWVYGSAWFDDDGEAASFWGFRWPALAFGLLSLGALLFCGLVSDDSIDKGSGIFITYVLLQSLVLAWLVTYFILTLTVDSCRRLYD